MHARRLKYHVRHLFALGITASSIFLALAISAAPQTGHADGSQTYSTPGTYTFTVPSYGTLTVQVWGGGGGGGGGAGAASEGVPPTPGQTGASGVGSSFAGSVLAGAGSGGSGNSNNFTVHPSGGSGGSASGGTTNTSGVSGQTGYYWYESSAGRGAGGTSPSGGVGGEVGASFGAGCSPSCLGGAGASPGAGGGGGGPGVGGNSGGGGGSGAYVSQAYNAGDLTPGSPVTVVVGSGGSGGNDYGSGSEIFKGGAGAPGRVSITWTSALASCTFNGSTITSGSSVTAYQASSVPSGSSCVSESRLCTNGTLSGSYTYDSCTVDAQTSTPITGYLWSDTIGWISMNGTGYGVSIATDNTVSGYAWSDNVGWVKFGSLSSFPSGSGTTASNASLTAGAITGWARACAGTAAGDCSSMTSRSDGWDGWIALSGTGYGPTLSGGSFSGYSWGSTNLGWISWSGAATTYQACAATQGYSCVSGNSVHTDADCSQTTDVCTSYGSDYFCSSDNHLCTAPPAPSAGTNPDGSSGVLRAKPSLVKSGQTTKLIWTINNATACTVSGNGDSWNTTTSASGGNTTSPITQRTTYVLHCTSAGGTLDESADVTLIPKWQEQ